MRKLFSSEQMLQERYKWSGEGRHPPQIQIYPSKQLDDRWCTQNIMSNGNNLYCVLKHVRTFEQILSNQLFITISIFATKIDFVVWFLRQDLIYVVQAGTEFQIFLCYRKSGMHTAILGYWQNPGLECARQVLQLLVKSLVLCKSLPEANLVASVKYDLGKKKNHKTKFY